MMQRIKQLLKGTKLYLFLRNLKKKSGYKKIDLIFKLRIQGIYYSLFSRKFSLEERAVFAGLRRYHTDIQTEGSQSLLRRNVHRLEKGLIMRPRRETFALDYIEPTVDAFSKLYSSNANDPLIMWSRDVLDEYFRVVGKTIFLDGLRSQYEIIKSDSTDQDGLNKKIPYKRRSPDDLPTYDQFLSLSIQRRSVRWYQDKKVSRELIDKALIAAGQSPSACNRQPFEFKFFDDPELVQKVASIPMGTRGFAHNIPTIAVVVGKLNYYFDERDRHVIYIDGSLASMSFILALETLGLSSCCLNWPDVKHLEDKMKDLLNLEEYERPIMLIAIGHADKEGLIPYSQKKDLAQLRSFN